jgi:hypothetical protein
LKGEKMEHLKKIFSLLIISILGLTANAQQSPNINLEEPSSENDLFVGRTHYEDDIIFDNIGGTYEPQISNTITPAAGNSTFGITAPKGYRLYENYPNPFNPSTTIKFTIPEKGFVTLGVFDITGKEVSTLVSSQKNPGTYEVVFDAASLASGLYFYKITVNNFSSVRKMILIK